jgi:hypothetical protein
LVIHHDRGLGTVFVRQDALDDPLTRGNPDFRALKVFAIGVDELRAVLALALNEVVSPVASAMSVISSTKCSACISRARAYASRNYRPFVAYASMVHSPAAGIRFSPAVEPHSPARASGDQAEHLQVAHEQIPLQFSLMLLPMSPRRFELIIIMRRLAVFTIARQPRHTAPQNTFDIDHSYTRKECGHERRRED